MRTFVQFLKRNENGIVEPIKGKNDIKIIDDRKNLNAKIVEAFDLCNKHEQTTEIIAFNIVEVDSFQNREEIKTQIFL